MNPDAGLLDSLESLSLPAGAPAPSRRASQWAVIRSMGGRPSIDWRELWHFRELFYFFAWRDIRSRYQQTLLGIGWTVFQPLASVGMLSFCFRKVLGVPSDGLPYPLFCYAGI